MTQPITTTDLEELLEAEVPCNKCDNAAVLMSRCHGCAVGFKCVSCYQKWLLRVVAAINRSSGVSCRYCQADFYSVDDFSQWRPF